MSSMDFINNFGDLSHYGETLGEINPESYAPPVLTPTPVDHGGLPHLGLVPMPHPIRGELPSHLGPFNIPHPAAILGMRAALLRQLIHQALAPHLTPVEQHHPDQGGTQPKPANPTAAALKAAGALYRELAKHHEGPQQAKHPGRGGVQEQDRMRAHPRGEIGQLHPGPAHHPRMRPHPLHPYTGPLDRNSILQAIARMS